MIASEVCYATSTNYWSIYLMTQSIKTTLQQTALAGILFSTATSVFAMLPSVELNANSPVQSRLTASIVSLDPQGQETLSPITAQTKLMSGNVIEYHGYFINQSPDRIRQMKVTLNIPEGMELLGNISPDRNYGSIDGQKFMFMPIKTQINGSVQPVPNVHYKALQWDIQGLGLNEVAIVKYRAKVK